VLAACACGHLAAIMSTASAQLLVASSAFAQDFYKGLFRRNPGAWSCCGSGAARYSASRCSPTCSLSNPENRVLDRRRLGLAGFGAAFGRRSCWSLYWPRMTRNGALAGMLVAARL